MSDAEEWEEIVRKEVEANTRYYRFAKEERTAVIRYEQILKILPHRPPMLFVSFVSAIDEQSITAKYFVPYNSFWTRGHFPTSPIMPGCLIEEAGNQTFAVLALGGVPNTSGKNPALKSSSYRFHNQSVLPGDILRIEGKIVKQRGRLCEGEIKIYIETERKKILVAHGTATGFLG